MLFTPRLYKYIAIAKPFSLSLPIRHFSTIPIMSSRYAESHKSLQGPGDARPTALDIVKDEGLEGKLSDKVFLVTGCSSGIGIETARALSATGAKLFLTVRDVAKGESALAGILEPGRVELVTMDLNSLDSVRSAARVVLDKTQTLNILVNNAGVMATPQGTTVDGFETQFGTNHLAHFLLFQLLKLTLLASSTPSFHSRVVAVSSSGHRASGVRFGDYGFEKAEYSPWAAYGQSKTANIYMANEIERRYGKRGLHGLSLHPGGIMSGLQKHVPDEVKAGWSTDEAALRYMKNSAQGAATTVYAALSGEWEGKGGKYLEDCGESTAVKEGYSAIGLGYVPHAYDAEGEKRLWADSLGMVGLEDDDS